MFLTPADSGKPAGNHPGGVSPGRKMIIPIGRYIACNTPASMHRFFYSDHLL